MLPSHYVCTSCAEVFKFSHHVARYLLDGDQPPPEGKVFGRRLLEIPVRPGWCKHCAALCLVEDIAPVRAFEDAYGAVRAGHVVEYPTSTDNLPAEYALAEVGAFLRWRMGRRNTPRALCCGRTDYQLLDVPQPLLKHAECDFGVVEARYVSFGPFTGPLPGEYRSADIPVYDGEGTLIGLLTRYDRWTDVWEVIPNAYSPHSQD